MQNFLFAFHEIHQEVLTQFVGRGVKGPSAIDSSHRVDKLHQLRRGVEHERVYRHAVFGYSLDLFERFPCRVRAGAEHRPLDVQLSAHRVRGRLPVRDQNNLLVAGA